MAALAVCMFHFSCGNREFLSLGDPIKTVGSFGWLGVEAFFVISGFVIPYSLFLRGYCLRDSTSFFTRRIKRLEPPYLGCILLVIILHGLSSLAPGFAGGSLNLTWQRLLAHFGYLNAILDYGWLNPVFWTLAIEFQYYIFMALLFPILVHTNLVIRGVSVLGIALLGFMGYGNPALLPHWLPLFAIGMVTFQFYAAQMSFHWYATILLTTSAISYYFLGPQHAIVGALTALAIVLASYREISPIFAPFAFLGTISYSLYLLHVPIGGRIINLASRLPESVIYRYPAIVIALIVSVSCAYAFWWVIERPSQRWAKTSAVREDLGEHDEQAHASEPAMRPVSHG